MKNIVSIMAVATMALVLVSCGPKKEKEPKKLVLYYSQTSNTKAVAQEFATRLNADIDEILAVEPYNGDFKATIERAAKEREEGVTPDILPLNVEVKDYDIIFLGYPIWFGTYAPPVATFLERTDLQGKTIVPFCTFGSGGLVSSVKDLALAEPDAFIPCCYGVRAARLEAMPAEVDQFLKENHFLKGEFTILGDFDELRPVEEADAAIFEAAVGDYPMMNAKPEAVCTRPIPGGTGYLFIAVDLPREDMPDMPPAGQMKVYVDAIDGKTPEFTQVVR